MPDSSAPSFDVFLSYHSGDADWVEALKTALEAKGIRVWIDSEQIRPGDLFPGALARAIGGVQCVVLVLSPGSVASTWVEEEFNLALARRSRLIGALIDDVEPPGFLEGRTWVDFRDPAQFAAGVDQLVFGIRGERSSDVSSAIPPYRDLLNYISQFCARAGMQFEQTEYGLGMGDFASFPPEAHAGLHVRSPVRGWHNHERVNLQDQLNHVDLLCHILLAADRKIPEDLPKQR